LPWQFSHPSLATLFELADKAHHHHFHCHACNRFYELSGGTLNRLNELKHKMLMNISF
jgi:Fur family ferric uptake transcriptional regulator